METLKSDKLLIKINKGNNYHEIQKVRINFYQI